MATAASCSKMLPANFPSSWLPAAAKLALGPLCSPDGRSVHLTPVALHAMDPEVRRMVVNEMDARLQAAAQEAEKNLFGAPITVMKGQFASTAGMDGHGNASLMFVRGRPVMMTAHFRLPVNGAASWRDWWCFTASVVASGQSPGKSLIVFHMPYQGADDLLSCELGDGYTSGQTLLGKWSSFLLRRCWERLFEACSGITAPIAIPAPPRAPPRPRLPVDEPASPPVPPPWRCDTR